MTEEGAAAPLLSVRGVWKSYGTVAAALDVSFPLYGGEAHALELLDEVFHLEDQLAAQPGTDRK